MERSAQILLMRDIFRGAREVVIWLGERSHNSNEGMDLVGGLYDLLLNPEKADRSIVGDTSRGNLSLEPPRWTAVVDLFNRSWFRRVWVWQEVIVSSALQVFCGSKVLPWLAVAGVASRMGKKIIPWTPELAPKEQRLFLEVWLPGTPELSYDAANAVLMERFRYIMQQLGTAHILELLIHCRACEARNPRDKVFALLGLCTTAAERLNIRPDYSQSVEDLFRGVARYLLPRADGLDLLHNAETGSSRSRKLPSWVPDWTDHPKATPLDWSAQTAGYRAAADSQARWDLSLDSDLLTIAGKAVDVIEHLAEVPPHIRQNHDLREDFISLEDRSAALAKTCDRYDAELSIDEGYWRTLIANKMGEYERPPTEYATYFSNWRKVLRRQIEKEIFSSEETVVKCRDEVAAFTRAYRRASLNRRFGTTRKRYMLLAPATAEIGDVVCVLLGRRVPFAVRREEDGHYRLIGECYVHGLMDGEAMAMDDIEVQDFVLK